MYTPLVIGLFCLLLLVFHWIGIWSKGKISRRIWKSGDYIWLSMAMFAIVAGGYEARKAISDDVIQSARDVLIETFEKREENIRLATGELEKIVKYSDISNFDSTRLGQLAEQSVELDSVLSKVSKYKSEAEQNLGKNWIESHVVYFYPIALAIALALRFTLASADIFDWYAKPVTSIIAPVEQDELKLANISTSGGSDFECKECNSALLSGFRESTPYDKLK